MCAWCFQLLLHSEKEKLESVFFGSVQLAADTYPGASHD